MKISKWEWIFLCFLLFPYKIEAMNLEINSNNIILYNLDENKVLLEKNSEQVISIASLTKITTIIVAIEQIPDIHDKVVITSKDLEGLEEADASVAGFKVGEVVTYEDLLYGAMLPSGADATQALAHNICGSVEEFVELMNAKARELGMNHTHYRNTSGLDTENHYSTVTDVAIMLRYALQDPLFKTIYTTSKYTTSDGRLQLISTTTNYSERYHLNIDYIQGAKTGYTDKAGYCLSSIATIDNVHYLLITAGGFSENKQPYHFIDSINIYNYYSHHYQYYPIIKKGDVLATIHGKYSKESIEIHATEDKYQYLSNDEIKQLTYEYVGNDTISPFVKSGSQVGTFQVRVGDHILTTEKVLLNKVPAFSFVLFLQENIVVCVCIILVFLFLVGRVNYGKRKKH